MLRKEHVFAVFSVLFLPRAAPSTTTGGLNPEYSPLTPSPIPPAAPPLVLIIEVMSTWGVRGWTGREAVREVFRGSGQRGGGRSQARDEARMGREAKTAPLCRFWRHGEAGAGAGPPLGGATDANQSGGREGADPTEADAAPGTTQAAVGGTAPPRRPGINQAGFTFPSTSAPSVIPLPSNNWFAPAMPPTVLWGIVAGRTP
jgi:hypothetical protein